MRVVAIGGSGRIGSNVVSRLRQGDLAAGPPVNGVVEVAGPEPFPLDTLARKLLATNGNRHQVIADVHARRFGLVLNDRSLIPGGGNPRIGPTHFADWLSHASAQP